MPKLGTISGLRHLFIDQNVLLDRLTSFFFLPKVALNRIILLLFVFFDAKNWTIMSFVLSLWVFTMVIKHCVRVSQLLVFIY